MSDTLPSPCTRGVELPRPCTRVPPRPCTRGPDSPCVCAPKQRTRLTSVHNSNGLCVGAPGERWCARPWARGLVCPLRRALGRDPSHCWSHRPHEENHHGRESIPSPAPSHIGPTLSPRMRKKNRHEGIRFPPVATRSAELIPSRRSHSPPKTECST